VVYAGKLQTKNKTENMGAVTAITNPPLRLLNSKNKSMVDFQKQVIERSHTIPVLVDFWASWCGPCRMLGPVLEQLAKEQKDQWELVKLNTEEQPELAQEYGIRSIPNVKLFYSGKVVGEFAGALPKFQLEQWLAANLPDPSAAELQAILDGATTRPRQETEQLILGFLTAHPDNKEAGLALARFIVFEQPKEAVVAVDAIRLGDPLYDAAEDVRTLARLMQFDPENGSPAAGLLDAARRALQSNDPETAIQKIIEAAMADKSFSDELPRRAAIALFRLWGNGHELTRKYRRRFDMTLY